MRVNDNSHNNACSRTQQYWNVAANLVIEVGKEDAEKRTQYVEEGIGYILHGRDAQNPRLSSSTGVPGNQYRGDGTAILQGAAEYLGFQAPLLIRVGKRSSGHNNGNVLVRCRDIEEDTGCNGGGDQRTRGVGPTNDIVGNLDQ